MRMPSIQNMSTAQVIRLALLLSAGGFVVWLTLSVILWAALRSAGIVFDFWPMLEALSTAGAVAQVLGGGVVALWQLRDSVDSRNLSIYNEIFERLMSEENIEARRWIYLHLPDDPAAGLDALDPAGQWHVKRVLNSLDHLGFLLEQDWITAEAEDAIIKWVSPFVVKVWAKLERYVDYEAQRRHEPDYYDSIRKLAQRCVEWRRRYLPESEITWVEKAL